MSSMFIPSVPIVIFSAVLGLTACGDHITNYDLRDKTLACAAAFDEDLSVELKEHSIPYILGINGRVHFEEHVGTIFSNFPNLSEAKLRLYEDYIACIETVKVDHAIKCRCRK